MATGDQTSTRSSERGTMNIILCLSGRAVDPHSLYTDPDPAVFLNADPDPGPGPAEPNLKKKNPEEFS